MDYYSRFWCPRAISMVVKHRCALTWSSSTLVVLAVSGPFHGLLLAVSESRSDFHCSLRVGHRHSQCWVILTRFMEYFSSFWGPRAIPTIDLPHGAFMCHYRKNIICR